MARFFNGLYHGEGTFEWPDKVLASTEPFSRGCCAQAMVSGEHLPWPMAVRGDEWSGCRLWVLDLRRVIRAAPNMNLCGLRLQKGKEPEWEWVCCRMLKRDGQESRPTKRGVGVYAKGSYKPTMPRLSTSKVQHGEGTLTTSCGSIYSGEFHAGNMEAWRHGARLYVTSFDHIILLHSLHRIYVLRHCQKHGQ